MTRPSVPELARAAPDRWQSFSRDPNAPDVRAHVARALRDRRRGRILDHDQFLDDFVRGRTVLDIGAVAHVIERAKSPAWQHGRIAAAAKKVVGIDILEDAVAALCRDGFDVRCVDATSDVDLGERFERVVLGDVIEHVDNPVALLRFARRHLVPGGKVLCTTPNAVFAPYLVAALRHGSYLPNAEHVAWISPSHALELAGRAGLELAEYWLISGDGKTPARKVLSTVLDLLRVRESEIFAGSFAYVFELAP
jgi:2-polyprenyl-3-methyl-5-hydroxy-6-metoxy-1,4-benzoquinol methylase